MIFGKVSKQQKNLRGWLAGQFFPEESPFKDDNVEIYYKTFLVGDSDDKLHKHPVGKEYLIVISGRAVMRIGEETVELKEGDYVVIPNNTLEGLAEVKETFTIVGVRYPSIPNNKVFIE